MPHEPGKILVTDLDPHRLDGVSVEADRRVVRRSIKGMIGPGSDSRSSLAVTEYASLPMPDHDALLRERSD